jgi:hypothetical protein
MCCARTESAWWRCWCGQLRSYLLLLLVVAAVVSAVVGDRTEALIIGVIIALRSA